ncbi:hypothetical protein D049_4994B, partial [Vibrio parahaemolyticus VPTS-2010]
QGRNTERSHT